MQNVKKVNIENKNNHKRDRRRRKNMLGYYVLVAVLATGIAASLSVTLLFNVHEVEITGLDGSSYTEEEIVSSSGISRGDNLVRMNTDNIRMDMLNDLLMIDDVKIKKAFPHKVEMDIVPSIEAAYVECSGGYVLISENWRIIGQKEKTENKNLIVVKGFECVSSEEKTILSSKDHDKGEILKNILDEIKKQNIEKMVSVDITDKYDIELNYDNRITIKIEKPDDIEYKLKYAYKIITDELRENKNGYLTIWNKPNKDRFYCIGGDVAEGLVDGDYSVGIVGNADDMKVDAMWHGHIDPDLFGEELVKLAKYYNGIIINYP